MKNKEKRNIIILVIVAVAIIVGIIIMKNGSKNNNQEPVEQVAQEEFVRKEEDGTRVNTSSKLAETKKCENLEITDIELTEKNGESYIQATVKNNGSTAESDEFLTLKVVDKEGKTLTEVKGYVDNVNPGETYALKIKASADFANAYDFTVSK